MARAVSHRLTQIEQGIGLCSVCGPVKVYYHKHKSRFRCSNQCKRTVKRNFKEYYDRNKEKVKKANRERALWTFFRLTPEDLQSLDKYQACHPVFHILMGQRVGTDHDHKTGLIRGRLDWRINRAYGLIEKVAPSNTSEVLRALAEFHDNPPAITVLGGKRYGLIGIAKHKKKMVYGPPKPEADDFMTLAGKSSDQKENQTGQVQSVPA